MDTAVRTGRVDLLLEAAEDARSIAEKRFGLDALERALLLADPGAVDAAMRERALGLGVEPSLLEGDMPKAPPHAVLVPLVAEPVGAGFVRTFYVTYGAGIPDSLAPVLSRAASTHVARALGLAARHTGHGAAEHRLAAAQPDALAGMRIDGPSLAAATFVSALSLFTGRPVRPGTAVTGAIVGARVAGVGRLPEKLEGAARGRPDLTRLVVPAADAEAARTAARRIGREVAVVPVATLEALIDATLGAAQSASRDLDAAVREARARFRRGWEGGLWYPMREALERLASEVPERRPDLRMHVLTMLGGVARHLGAPEPSLLVLDRARGLLDEPFADEAIPDEARTFLFQHRALTLAQLCRFTEAASDAAHAVRAARRGRLRGELVRCLSSAGLVESARGRHRVAVARHREALALVLRHEPSWAPRTCAYLVEALGRAGDEAAARDAYREGMKMLRREAEGTARASKEAWLRTSRAASLVALGRFGQVARVLDAAPVAHAIAHAALPGLFARRWLGQALTHGRRREEGFAVLAASPVAYGADLLPRVRFLAHLNVLVEARARLALHAFDEDARARVHLALAHLPTYGRAPRLLAPAANAVRAALEGAGTGAAATALDRLIDACDRAR